MNEDRKLGGIVRTKERWLNKVRLKTAVTFQGRRHTVTTNLNTQVVKYLEEREIHSSLEREFKRESDA